MSTALILFVLALIVVHVNWSKRAKGYIDPAVLFRDAGFGLAFLYIAIEGSQFLLDYSWWKELGQASTFWQFLRIKWIPETAAAVVAIAILLTVVGLARRRAATDLTRTRLFGWVGYLAAIIVATFISLALIDPWTVALYLGAQDSHTYTDPIFSKGLTFYLFRLPFYQMIFGWAAAIAIAALVFYGLTLAVGTSAERMRQFGRRLDPRTGGWEDRGPVVVNPPVSTISLRRLVRIGAAVLLVIFAIAQFFARYTLLYSRHDFLYGADYVDARVGIPLYWLQIVCSLAAAVLLLVVQPRSQRLPVRRGGIGHSRFPEFEELEGGLSGAGWLTPVVVTTFIALLVLPPIVEGVLRTVKVHPNELTLERPYIIDHIRATRMAFNIEQNGHEEAFAPRQTDTLDLASYPDTANNIRLWDWPPFKDNITQLQALRPYYTFSDIDIDRYRVDGSVRQLMLAPRALDTDLLPPQAQTWVNLNLQYTHGYGAVAAMVNTATPEGQPELIIKDAPPQTSIASLRITRPQIYFGDETRRDVFVKTSQNEFDYPKGDDNAYNAYDGAAGVAIGSPLMRLASSISLDDWNIILSSYIRPDSRLLLHRQIMDRVQTLAPFLRFDSDPYLVIDNSGRLFWLVDAYTWSDRHPYSEPVTIRDEDVNYIRNSVKAVIDAYNGSVTFYVFDEKDPILTAYRRVFPHLFTPRSRMPADLLQHIRYPELLFSTQAETYRVYHMQDPQVFYNKEDQWDVARQVVTQESSQYTQPYYLMVQLPGEAHAEFVLMLPFTSRNRDNLIAWIAARCDPAHYGEIVFFRLPKEQLIYGPLQIQSRVDQDRTISKDLSLWNQQGSRVVRGSTLVLPVGGTFLYVEPISIQATQARMPELKKVVLAVGNRLVYADDLPSAIAELARSPGQPAAEVAETTVAPAPGGPTGAGKSGAPALGNVPPAVLTSIEQHLQRYRQLTAAGRLSEAGRELEAIDAETRRALSSAKTRNAPH